MPNRIDVIIERVNHLQETLASSVTSLNERLDKWERKNQAVEEFQSKVLGGLQATIFAIRILGGLLGMIQVVVIAWVGAVNYGLYTSEKRLTTIEVEYQLSTKAEVEKDTAYDSRLDAISRQLSGLDAEVQKVEVDQANMSHKH